ncbi:MAG: hypothetical protein ACI9R3_000461 [Verrucomicrobiales bacterium]|jgi:hypothetical protein
MQKVRTSSSLFFRAVTGIVPLVGLASLVTAARADRFYGDPPDAHHPWAVHDSNRPQPPRVEPGTFSTQEAQGAAPSDAVILFDGDKAGLSNWTSTKEKKWVVTEAGALRCTPGAGEIKTVAEFGDCQLHIEWAAPTEVKGDSQGRGNSGIFLTGSTEIQVLDNYDNPTYADGFAGSVYGVNPPMANPLHKPGEWQVYDIVYRRPVYKDGAEIDPGYVTVFINGVLVQDHTPLEGGGGHKGRSKSKPFPEASSLRLQDHGNTVQYRNIWYRPLTARTIEGGTNGRLSEEAAMAKRKEIAASIREDAAGLRGRERLLRTMESLCYEQHEETLQQITEMGSRISSMLEEATSEQLEERKDHMLQIRSAFRYMLKHHLLPEDFAAAPVLEEVIEAQGWNEKK